MEGAALRFLPIAEIVAARAAVRAATGEQDPRAWHWYVRQPQPGQIQVAQMTARAAKPAGKPQGSLTKRAGSAQDAPAGRG